MFDGFSQDDFAAFEERKRESKKYDHERIRVREKMGRLRDSLAPLILIIDSNLVPKISLAKITKRKKDVQSIWLSYVLRTNPSYTKNPQLSVEIGNGWLYIGIGIPTYTRKFRDNLAKLMITEPEIIRMTLTKLNPQGAYFKTIEEYDIEQLDDEAIQIIGREMISTTGEVWISLGLYSENDSEILSTDPHDMIENIILVFEWLYPIFVYVNTPRKHKIQFYDWAKRAVIRSITDEPVQSGPFGRTEPFDTSGHTRESSEGSSFIDDGHKKLANAFLKWLKIHGFEDVRMEVQYIDFIFQKGSKQFIAELKTSEKGRGRKAIRDALGQLVDYSYFGKNQPRDEWIIVLNNEPSSSEKRFIHKLRKELDTRFNSVDDRRR